MNDNTKYFRLLKRYKLLQQSMKKLEAEYEALKAQQVASEDFIRSLPNCNTCDDHNCPYRPEPGSLNRVNCPLYKVELKLKS